MRHTQRNTLIAIASALGLLSATLAQAAGRAEQLDTEHLVELSFEELLNIEITSVSKKAQSLSDAAAAVHVITADDLRRSGARSIPDALRMVPGVQVAQIDSNKWAVTARSFNGRFANKLLVLIDGRSLYSPLYSGAYWESQTTLLEDIERIEVIRGPGATLWGANAVNGVINIITRSATQTHGNQVTAGFGDHEEVFGSFRHGFSIGPQHDARVYASYDKRDDFELAGGSSAEDDWDNLQAGFRSDGRLDGGEAFTVQGDLFSQDIDKLVSRPTLAAPYTSINTDRAKARGGNLLGRWTRDITTDNEIQLQAYLDYYDRDDFYVSHSTWNWDIDFQQRLQPRADHDLVWGLGYRYTDLQLNRPTTVQLADTSHHAQLFSAFVQDEITLVPDRWWLTVGSKFEHNDISGFEIQPSLRLAFKPDPGQTLWAAVSRAVRTPSVGERETTIALATVAPFTGINAASPIPLQLVLSGNTLSDSEDVLSLEAGWRTKISPRLSFDVAAYYNQYDNGRYAVLGTPSVLLAPVVHTRQPLSLVNGSFGEQWGIELATDWRPSDALHFQFAYSHQQIHDHSGLGRADINEGSTPQNQLSLRTHARVSDQFSIDLWLRYVDELDGLAVNVFDRRPIPAYAEADLRLSWQPRPDTELALVGRNLLSPSHAEFVQETFTLPSEVERSVYGYLKVAF